MVKEVIEYLDLGPGKVVVDATMGTGGHSKLILERILPGGRLIGIDRDEESLRIAERRLSDYSGDCDFVYGNFADFDSIIESLKPKKVDAILFDLGISSYQLDNPERGFSFQNEGPLDMRMDRNSYISAYDLVNNLNEEELSTMLKVFGQERWHNRIARFLVAAREKQPIATTRQLGDIVMRAIGHRHRQYRIHPATRTFQAVRIAVNRELEILDGAITKAIEALSVSGRICVIAFHSLEDRVIKLNFRKEASGGRMKILTPKPLVPSLEESSSNPSSRSAKLRAALKV